MEYPKPIMKRTELMEMGFPETYLNRAYASKGQTFATKMNPLKKKSPVLYDTAGFERWRQEEIKMQDKAMEGRR